MAEFKKVSVSGFSLREVAAGLKEHLEETKLPEGGGYEAVIQTDPQIGRLWLTIEHHPASREDLMRFLEEHLQYPDQADGSFLKLTVKRGTP